MRTWGWMILALAIGCGGGGAVEPGSDAGSIVVPDASQARDAEAGEDAAIADAGAVDAGPVSCVEDACTGGGVCTGGPTCDDVWTCSYDPLRECTDDVAPFCGCDGVTFHDSSTCPSRAFVHRGPCEGPERTSCDPRGVSCDEPEPDCPDGTFAEVEGTCWSQECVPIEECVCEESDECPDPLMHVCYAAGHCGYPL